jgi:hypothetical protein
MAGIVVVRRTSGVEIGFFDQLGPWKKPFASAVA